MIYEEWWKIYSFKIIIVGEMVRKYYPKLNYYASCKFKALGKFFYRFFAFEPFQSSWWIVSLVRDFYCFLCTVDDIWMRTSLITTRFKTWFGNTSFALLFTDITLISFGDWMTRKKLFNVSTFQFDTPSSTFLVKRCIQSVSLPMEVGDR